MGNTSLLSRIKYEVLKYKIKTIHYKLDRLTETYAHLQPITTRQKRGLINGIGSIINSITGNLDQDDLITVEKTID